MKLARIPPLTLAAILLMAFIGSAEGSGEAPQAVSESQGAAPPADMMKEGEQIAQKTCVACHGPQGGGAVGPPLRQNVADARGVVKAITEGRGEMPAFAAKFSDREIAAVVTFVRNSWGNSFGAVTEAQAAEYRH